MVAPQQNPRRRQAAAGSYLADEVAKVLGPHTRVATGLVDLVRGSFDQHMTAVIRCLQHRGLEHQRMGRTDRRDAERLSRLLMPHDVVQRIQHD